MKVPKAILLLRERADLSQADLAKRIGGTSFTISRWETGRRAPSSIFLERLAELSGSNGFTDLRDFFDGQRKLIIAARMRNLQSAGTQRRVSVHELDALGSFFKAAVAFAQDNIQFFAFMERELQDELGDELLQKLKEIKESNVAFRDGLNATINSMDPYLPQRVEEAARRRVEEATRRRVKLAFKRVQEAARRRAEEAARLAHIESMLEMLVTHEKRKGTDGKAK